MAKSRKYGEPKGGNVLAIRCNESRMLFIGTPSRMFAYDEDSIIQGRLVCKTFHISADQLKRLTQTAKERKGEFVFVTL